MQYSTETKPMTSVQQDGCATPGQDVTHSDSFSYVCEVEWPQRDWPIAFVCLLCDSHPGQIHALEGTAIWHVAQLMPGFAP